MMKESEDKLQNGQASTRRQNEILQIKQELEVKDCLDAIDQSANRQLPSPTVVTKVETVDYIDFKRELYAENNEGLSLTKVKKERPKRRDITVQKRNRAVDQSQTRRKSTRYVKSLKKDGKSLFPEDVKSTAKPGTCTKSSENHSPNKTESFSVVKTDVNGEEHESVAVVSPDLTVRDEPTGDVNLEDVEIVEPTEHEADLGTTERVVQNKEGGPFLCDICNKTIPTGSQMQRHLQSHQNERNYRCDQCDKTYKSSSSLSGHLKTCHSGERPYVCQTCGKTFPRQNSLNRHNMIHTGVKPFACEECGKRFPQSSYLKAHMRNHTGEKPFQCPDCGDRFKHSGYLMDHRRRIHTGEKRHECGTCGKLFARASDRLRHERTHGEPREDAKRQYKCHDCGIRFKFREKLTSHTEEGRCKRTYKIGRVKLSQAKVRVKVKHGSVSPKPSRKQLKPRRAKLKEIDCESVQSDSSLVSHHSEPKRRRGGRREKKPKPNHAIPENTPLVFFEDDPPPQKSEIVTDSPSTLEENSQYRCETCGEKFENSSNLIEHNKIHKKPFRCLTCDISFTWSLDLVKHTKLHSDEGENYEYEIYSKRYKSDGVKMSS